MIFYCIVSFLKSFRSAQIVLFILPLFICKFNKFVQQSSPGESGSGKTETSKKNLQYIEAEYDLGIKIIHLKLTC